MPPMRQRGMPRPAPEARAPSLWNSLSALEAIILHTVQVRKRANVCLQRAKNVNSLLVVVTIFCCASRPHLSDHQNPPSVTKQHTRPMNNFGVFEVASAKTTSAPGWAYVPDTSYQPTAAANALQPTNRKRARTTAGPSIGDLSARQEARLRKEVEALQRDGARDNTIPVPVRSGSRGEALPLLSTACATGLRESSG
jgi:hypothetical protein